MLVFISDLHFADGTAGEHNIRPEAFEYFFQDLIGIAGEERNAIKEIKLVFLGDIFDLLRTWYWLKQPVSERPWRTEDNDKAKEKKEEAALKIHTEKLLKAIAVNPVNAKSFQNIKDGWAKLQDKFPPPNSECIYFVGNHDRLVNRYPNLRKTISHHLPLSHDPGAAFPNSRIFEEYGVFARHGHEFDPYNFEGGPGHALEDYLQLPIGDPITTELVAKLSFELKDRLETEASMPEEQRDSIIRNFQEIDNVRPLAAIIEWLLYQVREKPPWLINLIENTVDQVITEFNQLSFVQEWYYRHDKWLDPFDVADQVQIALYVLEKFKVFSLDRLFSLVSRAKKIHFKDRLLEAAPDEDALRNPNIRYVVYGHSHEPLVMPLRVRQERKQLYLNTGTWRTRFQKALRDDSFHHWKNMTYVIFYRKGERPGREADFETWTGTLKAV